VIDVGSGRLLRSTRLTLVISAALLIGSCGSDQPQNTSPAPQSSSAAQDQATPTASSFSGIVQLMAPEGGPVRVTVLGQGGVVVGARGATAQERDHFASELRERGVILNLDLDASQLVVAWEGSPCDKTAVVTIDPPIVNVAPGARDGCDTFPVWRLVVVQLTREANAKALELTVEDVPVLP
jgi:hypothetical protein